MKKKKEYVFKRVASRNLVILNGRHSIKQENKKTNENKPCTQIAIDGLKELARSCILL